MTCVGNHRQLGAGYQTLQCRAAGEPCIDDNPPLVELRIVERYSDGTSYEAIRAVATDQPGGRDLKAGFAADLEVFPRPNNRASTAPTRPSLATITSYLRFCNQ